MQCNNGLSFGRSPKDISFPFRERDVMRVFVGASKLVPLQCKRRATDLFIVVLGVSCFF